MHSSPESELYETSSQTLLMQAFGKFDMKGVAHDLKL